MAVRKPPYKGTTGQPPEIRFNWMITSPPHLGMRTYVSDHLRRERQVQSRGMHGDSKDHYQRQASHVKHFNLACRALKPDHENAQPKVYQDDQWIQQKV